MIRLILIFSFLLVAEFSEMLPANAGAYSVGKSLVGLHERRHTGKLRRIVGVNPRRVPWCGAFVGYAVQRAGHKPVTGHLRALNWAGWGYGVKASQARKGDVVVIRTRRGHHVTLFAGWAGKGRFYGLGGNQSNQVKISTYSSRSIVAVRRATRTITRKAAVKRNGPTLKELIETWRKRARKGRGV